MFLLFVEPWKFFSCMCELAEILSGNFFLAYFGIHLNVGGRG